MSGTREWNDTSKDNPWYNPAGPKLNEIAKRVFGEYAGVAPQDLEKHLLEQRDDAWNIAPYTCVGLWGFTDFEISTCSVYQEVVERVKGGELLLDAGTGIGQDLRLLAADGCPSENLYSTDLSQPLYEVGYGLFNDREKFKGKFIAANLPGELDKLDHLKGKLSFIHAGNFFHILELEPQEEIAAYFLKLLKGQGSNSILFGRQVGTQLNTRMQRTPYGSCFRYTPPNLEEFWQKAAEKVGLKVEVNAYLRALQHMSAASAKSRPGTEDDPLVKIMFTVRVP